MEDLKKYKEIYEATPIMDIDEYIKYYKLFSDKIRYLACHEIYSNPGISGKELLLKFKVSQPTMSFHVAQLVDSGIVVERKEGQRHLYFPNYRRGLSFYKTSLEHNTKLKSFLQDIYVRILEEQKTSKKKK